MAAAPEDGGYLDPFSPSVFLDLSPTPHSDGDEDGNEEDPDPEAAALPDDLVLPYISRILMEEDMDDKFFYQYPDHPALLQAQQPFAEIHSNSCSPTDRSSSDGGAATTDTSGSGICSFTLSPSSFDDSAAFADAACWPHDPVELTHLLTAGADTNAATALSSSLLPGGQEQSAQKKKNRVISMEMLNQAFLKGMEEASKLLPTTNSSSRDIDIKQQPHVLNASSRGRKNRHDDWDGGETVWSRKLLVPEPEETGEMVDQMVTHGRALCLDQLKRLSITMAAPDDGSPANKKKSSRNTVVDLRTSLLHCAQAVSMDDRRGAAELLRQIKRQSSPTGDANQRLAYCFAEGLEARLAGTGSHLYRSLMARRTSLVDFLRAYQLYLAATCFNMIAFFFSHMAITKAIDDIDIAAAAAGKSKKKKELHIVDYGVQYGCQWPSLIDALSKRNGGPPEVRMTCIDLPEPGFRPAARIQETGRRLSDFAARCGVPFTFSGVVAAKWETVRVEDLDIRPDDDEVLVVNSTTRFQNFMDHEGATDGDVHSPSPRDLVLGNIRRMKPDVFVLSVVNGSHNSPFFLARFREALFYYSAMFDILDATAPRDDEQRLVVERDLIGRCALNVVACEGADRVERPETYRQWQARCRRAGFRVLSERVSWYYHRDFVVDVDGHWPLGSARLERAHFLCHVHLVAASQSVMAEDSEPFSPSIFLDLPPTPRADGDDDPAAASMPSGDPALPFISRMLMEEEDINRLYHQCPVDHPALLMVQQPFAEILSDTGDYDVISNGSAELGDAGGVQSRASLDLNLKEDTIAITGTGALPTDDDGDDQLQVMLGAQVVQAAEEDLFKLAFLKGMEEANKFLPTGSTNLLLMCNVVIPGEGEGKHDHDHEVKKKKHSKNRRKDEDDDFSATGPGGRSSKMMMVSDEAEEEEADGETVDKMIINDFNSCLGKMKRLHITADGAAHHEKIEEEAGDLHTLLVHCAQAVGSNDRWSAAQLLGQIKKLSSPTGDANQRLAHCFAEGLEARLAGTGVQVYSSRSLVPSVVEYVKAYQLYLDACCFRMTSFTFSNRCILKAVAAGKKKKKKKKVHIVDYGIDYGWQWPALLSRFAAMEGGPPEVRITGIDLPQPGFRPSSRLDETGRRLSSGARQLGVPFQFRSIAAARWETVRADDLRSMDNDDDDELLVVNSLCPFGTLADEGVDVDSPSPRDAVLSGIRELRPDLFILCAANAYHSSPFFVRRFRDALSYYSAMFDMVDATIPPRHNAQRLLIERHVLGRCALNAVACEGADRVERPEPYRQWQARNGRVGLRQLPLDPAIVEYVKERVRSLYHRDFFIDTDQQWLLQGWKGRILYAMPQAQGLGVGRPAMADTPENPEPSPPSIFPFITRMLMDEDEDMSDGSFFRQYPDDHPALLTVQRPFAEILSDMEEANKFLPTTTTDSLLIGTSTSSGCAEKMKKKHGKNKRRNDEDGSMVPNTNSRNTKLMVLQVSMPEQHADGEMVAQIIINEFNVCIADLKRPCSHITVGGAGASKAKQPAAHNHLHTLLIHCARAVGTDDRVSAAKLLAQIKAQSSPRGDPNQRLAHCFAQGLAARLAGTGTQAYRSAVLVSKRRSSSSDVEYLKAYRLYLESCCFRMTSFSFANWSILKAVAARRKKVHIVDYGIDYGAQWRAGRRSLGLRPSSRLEETGRRLSSCARQLGVPFRFQSIVSARWETIRADDLGIDPDELLVTTTAARSPRDAVLGNIWSLRPDLFILGIANGSYSSPFFVTRFREALSYYTALFDMLDATIPRDKEQRLLVERDIFGRCAMNAVVCEGPERVERPEAYRQWQTRNYRAGLRQLPLDQEIVQYVREKIRTLFHKDFVIDTDQQWLLKGWKGRILYAISTWLLGKMPVRCTGYDLIDIFR
ncbi:hypothetical protein U9M48_000197, partial [Paspalum notatum var. saurae]